MKSYKIPISVKGIVFDNNSVWLRKNEREEWELPGGKIDQGEQPTETLIRELREELGFEIEVMAIIHVWVHRINDSQDESLGVLVLSYLCRVLSKTGIFETESEGGKSKFKKFKLDEIKNLNIPEFYKDAINLAWKEYVQIGK